jgi:Tol biopolymer transport system component
MSNEPQRSTYLARAIKLLLLACAVATASLAPYNGYRASAQSRIAAGPPESVAFNSSRDGNSELYVMNPDGTEQTRITDNSATDNQPHISPNGKKVAFRSNRITPTNPTGDFEIFVMDIDDFYGTDVRQLTFNTADDVWPRWSPNGKQIAFHSNVDGNFEIYIVNSDTMALTRVTNYAGLDQWPEWSPDGNKLAIRRDMDIYIIDLRSREEPIRLTEYPTTIDQMPSWSPNGNQLAFMSLREGYCSVFVMDTDGMNQVNLTPKDPNDPPAAWCSRAPAWSRNGSQIYFMSIRPGTGGTADIFVMNADGTGVEKLTRTGGPDEFPTVR